MTRAEKAEAAVEVRCVDCKTIWWVGPDGKDQPECPSCHSVGVPTGRARQSRQERTKS